MAEFAVFCAHRVCGCYRSPGKCKELEFLTSLSSAAETMFRSRQELLLIGDMNMDMYFNEDKNQLPWITPQIQREILLCNRLFKHHKKNPSSSTWEAHKIQRNKVTSLKRNCIREFCSAACSATKNHGEFWKKLKLLLPATVPNQQEKIILVENDEVISDPKLVAKIFNDYFANTVDTVMNQLLIIPLIPA